MIRTAVYTILLGAILLAHGCKNMSMEEFRWDWWNKSAKDPEPADDVSGDFVAPEDVPKDVTPPGDSTAEQGGTNTGEEPKKPVIQPMDSASLELRRHKQDVWGRVVVLRDIDELPKEQQSIAIQNARRDLKDWYAPLETAPPDPESKDWIDILVWDFMPDEDFRKQSAKWKDIANKLSVNVPVPLTRRGMVPLITDILKLMEDNNKR